MSAIVWILAAYGALVGAALASFGCVVSERRARGEQFWGGRSHCACGRPLRAWENVPVAGWLVAGGRARCCGSRIPARYLVTESIGLVVGAIDGTVCGRLLVRGAPAVQVLAVAVVDAGLLLAAVIVASRPRA